MKIIRSTVLTVLVTTAAVATLALPAQAKGADVVRRGDCTGAPNWKLKVGPDNGRLEVEGEIDSNRAGQRWSWTLRRNGTLVGHGVRSTAGRSGSFEVRRIIADASGQDRIVFRAVRPATGQVCRGVLTF